MRRLPPIAAALAALAVAAPAASGAAGPAERAAAKGCTANAEVTPTGKIAFGLSCGKSAVGGVTIGAGMSDVRKVKPKLIVDPKADAVRVPRCGVSAGIARCKGNVRAGAIITGWIAVAGDACAADLTIRVRGGASKVTIPVGPPSLC